MANSMNETERPQPSQEVPAKPISQWGIASVEVTTQTIRVLFPKESITSDVAETKPAAESSV